MLASHGGTSISFKLAIGFVGLACRAAAARSDCNGMIAPEAVAATAAIAANDEGPRIVGSNHRINHTSWTKSKQHSGAEKRREEGKHAGRTGVKRSRPAMLVTQQRARWLPRSPTGMETSQVWNAVAGCCSFATCARHARGSAPLAKAGIWRFADAMA